MNSDQVKLHALTNAIRNSQSAQSHLPSSHRTVLPNQLHNSPSTPSDLADSLMADTVTPRTSEEIPPSQAPPSAIPLSSASSPDDLVRQLLNDNDIYNHIFRSDRAAYLDKLASVMRSSMTEIEGSGLSFGGPGHMNHNTQIQTMNHQAGYQAQFGTIPPPPLGNRAGSIAQFSVAPHAPSNTLNGMNAIGTGRPSDFLPFDNDPVQMSARERQIALAQSLLEVPLTADGVFHADGFAASGVDVEMLERDMDATVAFMRPTPRS